MHDRKLEEAEELEETLDEKLARLDKKVVLKPKEECESDDECIMCSG